MWKQGLVFHANDRTRSKMAIPYNDAVQIIESEARQNRERFHATSETVPLRAAVNRIIKDKYYSSEQTPTWDTSAMDGYALNSEVTRNASEKSPVICRVIDTVAAGDEPLTVAGDAGEDDIYPCVEIMTGARFPSTSSGKPFDCCVRVEDTIAVNAKEEAGQYYVKILKPARPNQHKRRAGEDFSKGDLIINEHTTVRPHHIMALASVGCTSITVLRKPHVALYSTGSELALGPPNSTAQRIPDTNGPYISTMLKDLGLHVDFLGVIEDDAAIAAEKISRCLKQRHYDILITTGAVSAGRYDFVREALEALDAHVLFHKIAMRPGHPALFASLLAAETTLSSSKHTDAHPLKTAFFGLPGNPVAAAACLRFLLLPYVQTLLFQSVEKPMPVIVRSGRSLPGIGVDDGFPNHDRSLIATFPPDTDVFRLGTTMQKSQHILEVELMRDHSPGKVRPFLGADCWVHIRSGETQLYDGDIVDVFPMN
jgi:molybdopterin molybdotransferase